MVNLKDQLVKAATTLHKGAFRLTDGRIGGTMLDMPGLILTHTGRKSGKKRTTMLTTPLVDGDKVVLVASNFGDSRHPKWFLNVREHPDVEITLHGHSGPKRARVAEGEERADLWERLTAKHTIYADYQKGIDREIPVVVLEPR